MGYNYGININKKMAKKTETKENDKKEVLVKLLKARMPACFEREAVPAFAMKNVEALADEIIAL